jgi:hypothetical protein
VAQHKYKLKNPKKKHPRHNNKQKTGPKPSPPDFSPNGDKGAKSKSKKNDQHFKFCGRDGHVVSECFKNMESLEETMNKHNINIDYFSSSHGHELSISGFSFNGTSSYSSSYE